MRRSIRRIMLCGPPTPATAVPDTRATGYAERSRQPARHVSRPRVTHDCRPTLIASTSRTSTRESAAVRRPDLRCDHLESHAARRGRGSLDRERVLSEMARVLKPGGSLLYYVAPVIGHLRGPWF